MTRRELEAARCQCEICRKMREDSRWEYLPGTRWQRETHKRGICELCGQDKQLIAPWLPDLLKEFFNVSEVCVSCRRGIAGVVDLNQYGEGWGLCWQSSPDDALKWAMVAWMRIDHFGNYEFMRISKKLSRGPLGPMKGFGDKCYL